MLKQSIAASTALLTATLLLPAGVDAQERGDWSIDGSAGVGVPGGDLGNLWETGANVAFGIGYEVHPRVDLRANWSGDFLTVDGDRELGELDEAVPDLDIFHYTAGVEVQVTPPTDSPWDITVNADAGAATLNSLNFPEGPLEGEDFSETYFTTNGGVKVGYQVSSSLDLFTRAQAHLVLTDEEDTDLFTLSPELEEGFDTAVTYPIQLGARLTF